MSLEDAAGAAYGEPLTLPRAALFGARQALQMRAAVEECRDDTGLIVELGSGWGLNVLDIYIWGGPARARYRGLELSRSGRACAEALAALESGLDFQSVPFNYYTPDYSTLPEETGHVLVFSSHSIEQIRTLPKRAISDLLDRYPAVTGVHFEPIGWQVREETGKAARVGATRENSARAGYNENFWPMIRSLEADRRIEIVRCEPDWIGHKTKNVATLIVWRSSG